MCACCLWGIVVKLAECNILHSEWNDPLENACNSIHADGAHVLWALVHIIHWSDDNVWYTTEETHPICDRALVSISYGHKAACDKYNIWYILPLKVSH